MGKILNRISDWLDTRIRRFCGRISKDTRIILTALILCLSSAGSIYIFIRTIYCSGRAEGKRMVEIEHIRQFELESSRRREPDTNRWKESVFQSYFDDEILKKEVEIDSLRRKLSERGFPKSSPMYRRYDRRIKGKESELESFKRRFGRKLQKLESDGTGEQE